MWRRRKGLLPEKEAVKVSVTPPPPPPPPAAVIPSKHTPPVKSSRSSKRSGTSPSLTQVSETPLPVGWEAAEAIVGEKRVGGKVKYLCTFKGYGDEQFMSDEISKELELD